MAMRTLRWCTALLAISNPAFLAAQSRAESAGQVFERGGAEFLKGNFASAEKLFRQAAQMDPAMIDAQEYLGHTLFREERYQEAIPVYLRVLRLDSKRVLPLAHHRVVIDELGMAYGISGDLPTAKSHFETAIQDDPDYPMFYYNLACAYGEMGDLDHVLANLRAAFARKQNLNQFEDMPDPAHDDSFGRFVQDPRFKKFLGEIQR